MKKLLLLSLLTLSLSTKAQVVPTNTVPPIIPDPVWSVLQNLTTATNFAVDLYGGYATDHKDWGGGVAIVYNFSQFLGSMARLDYINSKETVYMPSLNLQFQVPLSFGTKLKVTPFVFSGVGIPIAGTDKNGQMVGIVGGGLAARFGAHFGVATSYEYWTNLKTPWIRFGPYWKF